jgi:hypothetical protein
LFDLGSQKTSRLVTFSDKAPFELKWLPDGRGILALYQQAGPSFARAQIGFIPIAGGAIQPITRDTNRYLTLTISGDGKMLASVQLKITQNLYLLPGSGGQSADSKAVFPQGQEVRGFSWAADGGLLVSDGPRLLRVAADGKNQTQLIGDSTAGIVDPRAAEMIVCSFRGFSMAARTHLIFGAPTWMVQAR